MIEEKNNALVLVVDDIAETLTFLHDSLEECGFDVLIAGSGEKALDIASKAFPEIVLLDALMPGMNGFEVCRKLKQNVETQHIPVIFMTGLTESEHIVEAFEAGGDDYVTKPVRMPEVIVRLNAHLMTARRMSQTQGAFDAFGQGAIAVLPQSAIVVWRTPLAQDLIAKYFLGDGDFQREVDAWTKSLAGRGKKSLGPLMIERPFGKLLFTPADVGNTEQWLILIREESEGAQIEALRALFSLTKREAEVLHWIILGKTDKAIAQIFGSSPRTVNKHVEHILEKLEVETRTAAAGKAMKRLSGE